MALHWNSGRRVPEILRITIGKTATSIITCNKFLRADIIDPEKRMSACQCLRVRRGEREVIVCKKLMFNYSSLALLPMTHDK